jgi:3-dehydroquinate synthase
VSDESTKPAGNVGRDHPSGDAGLLPDRIEMAAGLVARAGGLLAADVPAARYAVISDGNVAPLHGAAVAASLRDAGRVADLLEFPAGEASKNRDVWSSLADRLAALGAGRDTCVVAVGGGVTLDLAGFVAATWARGVDLVLVPTTLLGMVDAAWGGKTGLDLPAGKNLVGALHRPRAVLIDPSTLRTLPAAELRYGLAEAVKHAVVRDAAQLEWIGARASALLAGDEDALLELVRASSAIKRAVVAADPRERGERQILNHGHTVAHGLERVTEYALPHGAAVAVGLVAEAAIGEAAGVTARGTADRVAAALAALGLPTRPPAGVSIPALVAAMRLDKKARAGETRYALPARVGEAARDPAGRWTFALPEERVTAALAALWRMPGRSTVSAERTAV